MGLSELMKRRSGVVQECGCCYVFLSGAWFIHCSYSASEIHICSIMLCRTFVSLYIDA